MVLFTDSDRIQNPSILVGALIGSNLLQYLKTNYFCWSETSGHYPY